MAQYILLLHEDPASFADVSPSDMEAIIEKYMNWRHELAAKGLFAAGQGGIGGLGGDGGRRRKDLVRPSERLKEARRLAARSDFRVPLAPAKAYLTACWRNAMRGRLIVGALAACITGLAGLAGAAIYEKEIKEQWFWIAHVSGYGLEPAQIAALKPREPFWECRRTAADYSRHCPGMIVVPAGEYVMGSHDDEGSSEERPRHKVTIRRPFAVSIHEVTFDQYDACYAAGGCKVQANDYKWGRGARPVLGVSWDDAQEYVAWLSQMTDHKYRLPTEAEWEYAARGLTSANAPHSPYPWGDKASHEYANYGTDECCEGHIVGRDRWLNSAPVGQFPPNAFGLHDMHGNVWEWVEDCWNDSYRHKADALKQTGGAWTEGNCSRRVARGGSWNNRPAGIRSPNREGFAFGLRDNHLGFRVAYTF